MNPLEGIIPTQPSRPPMQHSRELSRHLRAESRRRDASVEAARWRTELEEAIATLNQAENNYLKAVNTLASTNLQRATLEKAARVQNALVEFQDALVTKKIKEVEVEVTRCFNMLSRKRIDRSIGVNPITFQVSVKDSHSRLVPKSELSSGEKQIYAVSVLWALARVSGRPLPMIIDTPLARLDRDHRALLGHAISLMQVIKSLFSPPTARSIGSSSHFFKDRSPGRTSCHLIWARKAHSFVMDTLRR